MESTLKGDPNLENYPYNIGTYSGRTTYIVQVVLGPCRAKVPRSDGIVTVSSNAAVG